MKRLTAAVTVMLVCMAGCSEGGVQESTLSRIPAVTSNASSEEESTLTAADSSEQMPLGLHTWGLAAKYDPVSESYREVPVRITRLTEDTADVSLPEGYHWKAAEYEISLQDYPVPEGGVTAAITCSVLSGYALTVDLSEEAYAFEGILKGKVAYPVADDAQECILVFGETGEKQAFFKV